MCHVYLDHWAAYPIPSTILQQSGMNQYLLICSFTGLRLTILSLRFVCTLYRLITWYNRLCISIMVTSWIVRYYYLLLKTQCEISQFICNTYLEHISLLPTDTLWIELTALAFLLLNSSSYIRIHGMTWLCVAHTVGYLRCGVLLSELWLRVWSDIITHFFSWLNCPYHQPLQREK